MRREESGSFSLAVISSLAMAGMVGQCRSYSSRAGLSLGNDLGGLSLVLPACLEAPRSYHSYDRRFSCVFNRVFLVRRKKEKTMKASLTFRDEKSPLIRLNFPVNLAGFPLASGITIGDNEDLSLHLGTTQEACPSVKLAYHPNLPSSPVSLILKAGIAPWGPPRLAAVSVSAELRLSRFSIAPFFTVHIKPRFGDFSFRKMLKVTNLILPADASKGTVEDRSLRHIRSHSHRQRSNGCSAFLDVSPISMAPGQKGHSDIFGDTDAANKGVIGSSRGIFDDAHGVTPRQLDNNHLYTPMPFHGPPFPEVQTITAAENEVLDNWGNDFVKIDEFEHRNRSSYDASTDLSIRSLDDGPSSFNNFKDQQSGAESPLSASAGSCLNEEEAGLAFQTGTSPIPWRLGVDESIKGWSLHAHSTLPLGAQTTLNIRWGVNAPYDWMRGWDSPLSSIKFPYLYLQKMSLCTTGSSTFSSSHSELSNDQLESLAQDDEMRELSPVAALCGSTKRQLQLLYAENQVLRKAMQEMKTQFEHRSSGKLTRLVESIEDVMVEEQIGAPKVPDHTPELKGSSKERKDSTAKGQQGRITVADKVKRNQAHDGLDALKKLGGLGKNGGNGRHNSLWD